jgi:4-hydroxy-3-methylbut-2-enyl diphosphate reductase
VRLVEVALEAGADAAHLIDNASLMREEWLEGVTTVGVTSGASVPDILVRDLLERLAGYGYDSVEGIETAQESLTFSLPKELRKDLRAEPVG